MLTCRLTYLALTPLVNNMIPNLLSWLTYAPCVSVMEHRLWILIVNWYMCVNNAFSHWTAIVLFQWISSWIHYKELSNQNVKSFISPGCRPPHQSQRTSGYLSWHTRRQNNIKCINWYFPTGMITLTQTQGSLDSKGTLSGCYHS